MKRLLLVLCLMTTIPFQGMDQASQSHLPSSFGAPRDERDRKHTTQPEVPQFSPPAPAASWRAFYHDHSFAIWVIAGTTAIGVAGWVWNKFLAKKTAGSESERIALPDAELASHLQPHLFPSEQKPSSSK